MAHAFCRIGTAATLLMLMPAQWHAHAQDYGADSTSLWDRPYLTGDWNGARTSLAERGFVFDFDTTHFYQGLASGGPANLRGEWEYGGVGDAYLTIVGDRFGWTGFSASIHAETRFGESINAATGLAPSNIRLLYPPDQPPVVAVTNYTVAQQIGGGWAVSAGKFNVQDFWEGAFKRGKGVDGFMNASLVLPLVLGVPITGYSIPGAAILKKRDGELEGAFTILDTKDYSTKFGTEDLFNQGASIVGAWKFFHDIYGLPGYTSVVGIYNTREFESIAPSNNLIIPGVGTATAPVRGTWAVSGILVQKLWMDHHDPKRHVELFAQLGLGDDDPNPVNWIGGVTMEAKGLIPTRDLDAFGVGYFYTGLSSNYKDLLRTLNVSLRNLQGVEVYYKLGLTPWLSLTADLQAVETQTVGESTAIISGLRTKVTF